VIVLMLPLVMIMKTTLRTEVAFGSAGIGS
jgi:hypothetical protein